LVENRAKGVQSKQRYMLDFRMRRSDGAFRTSRLATSPIVDANGEIMRWISSVIDI
jgi:PAS domain-containing protein